MAATNEAPKGAASALAPGDAPKAAAADASKVKPATAAAPRAPLLPATAGREDNMAYDLRYLSASDIAPVPHDQKEADFLEYTRDSVQLMVNKIFSLPQEKLEEGIACQLPKDEPLRLPRSKPVPTPKPKTRWEKFADEKGIKKRKRSKMVWDEAGGDWAPRWGYNSIKKRQAEGQEAIYEVKQNEDSYADPFAKMKAEKNLLVARQRLREVRNKVEAAGASVRVSAPDLTADGVKRGKDGLKEALRRAQVSTGSRGKFDRVAPNEPTNLNKKTQRVQTMSSDKEKDRNLRFATRVLSGQTEDKSKMAKVGNQQAEGKKTKKTVTKGKKGDAGKGRRSKAGGRLHKK